MVVDIGGGTTEVGILSLGGMVYKTSLKVAGDTFDEAIMSHVRRHHGILIGEATAERLKKTVASAWSKSEGREMEVKGRDMAEGVSRALTLTSAEVYEAISEPLDKIVQTIKEALELTPPELSADIGDKGMVIAGGGALMRDMDRRLMEDTGLPVVIADDPLTCVVRGCGRALEEMESLGYVFVHE
jgi:rod shape-determining protein MreB